MEIRVLMLKNICETMQKRIKEMGQHQILRIMKIHINIVVDETKRSGVYLTSDSGICRRVN